MASPHIADYSPIAIPRLFAHNNQCRRTRNHRSTLVLPLRNRTSPNYVGLAPVPVHQRHRKSRFYPRVFLLSIVLERTSAENRPPSPPAQQHIFPRNRDRMPPIGLLLPQLEYNFFFHNYLVFRFMVIFCLCKCNHLYETHQFISPLSIQKNAFSLGLLSADRHRENERVVSNRGKSH